MIQNCIERTLDKYPFVVLDGGLATELEKKGFILKDRLWSARLIAEHPAAIRDVHLSYLFAGADCITTSSYQATIRGFMAEGYSRTESRQLIVSSMRLAREAVDIFNESSVKDGTRPEPFIAASAGCYGAYLANGSEYRGDYHLKEVEYRDFHRERLEILIGAGADLIAFETFPSFEEAQAVSDLMDEYDDIFYWIVFTIKDHNHTSRGDILADCIRMLSQKKNITGAGINCSQPGFVGPAIDMLEKKINIIVYPNSGEHFDKDCSCWKYEEDMADYSKLAQQWYSKGARIIGGCCRTGPEDIRKISEFRNSIIPHNVNT
jgi:homocysteine S-methyltransferase